MSDTIAAISTAFGEAALSVLRVSGPDALRVGEEVFRGRLPVGEMPSRVQHLGSVVDALGCVVDSALLTVFRAPASYTGEDMVEVSCHGGILVTRRIHELLLAAGARSAEPGEFTQRAFLNGKLDLTQAEAVMDLIHAQSELAVRAATQQLEGRLGATAERLREDLIHLLAHMEAYIDFPEEDIDPDTGAAMLGRIGSLKDTLRSLLDTAEHGRILRSGARTIICGAPNVGKSSLLNVLTGFERAIVSPQAGTTRDTIEEMLHIHGLPFRLVDTAGLREHTSDFIEQHGMERTRKELSQADVILEVVDGSAPQEEAHRIPVPPGKQAAHVLVLNKVDLGLHASWSGVRGIVFSATTGEGVESLRLAMRDAVWTGAVSPNSQLVAINARHKACFERARAALDEAAGTLQAGTGAEYSALHVREAMQAVGEVTGRVDVEEILGAIFSTFCIGK